MTHKDATAHKKCSRKVRHPTKDGALHAISRQSQNGWCAGKLVAYQCKFCGGWHVGNKVQGVDQ